MFSTSVSRAFDDPFFSIHHERMREMDNMWPRALTDGRAPTVSRALTDGTVAKTRRSERRTQGEGKEQDLALASPWDMFGDMNSMFGNMQRYMYEMQRQMMDLPARMEQMQFDPESSGYGYSHAEVMSYRNTGTGDPHVYQAVTTTRHAPGGVIKETRKAMRDSELAVEKMAIGHHIRDRGQEVTRTKNTRSGHVEENKNYYNLDEDDLPAFESEWQEKTSKWNKGQAYQQREIHDRTRPHQSRRVLPDADRRVDRRY